MQRQHSISFLKGRNLQRQLGFTLLEILVVLAIIAIVAGFALIMTGDFGHSRRVEAVVTGFHNNLKLAEQQAILQSSTFGVVVDNKGYRMYRLASQNNQDYWHAMGNVGIAHLYSWPRDVTVSVSSTQVYQALPGNIQPQIIISNTGEITPFVILFTVNNQVLYRMTGMASGQISVEHLPQQ